MKTIWAANGFRWHRNVLRPAILAGLWAIIVWGTGGCGQTWSTSTLATATPSVTVDAGIAPEVPPSDPADPADPVPDQRHLVIWLPDSVNVLPDDGSGNALRSTISQFERDKPGLHVEVLVKDEAGESNLLNYLLSAQRVAPSILPDLVLLNAQEIWQLADLGLAKPVEQELLLGLGDFYPFALDSVTYQDQIYGLPFAADVIQFAYFLHETETPPKTWEELLGGDARYLFPVAGRDGVGSESVLLQYVGAGGQLLENGTMDNPEALEAVFQFVADAVAQGIVPQLTEELATLESIWSALITAGSGYANVSSGQYWTRRDLVSDIGYAQVPTRNGLSTTIGRTWAFVILTDDPAQHALAQELLQHLLDPSVQGAWSESSPYLPTRPSALAMWSESSPYRDFLGRQLDVAVAIPNGQPFTEFARRVQAASLRIIKGEITPEAALLEIRLSP